MTVREFQRLVAAIPDAFADLPVLWADEVSMQEVCVLIIDPPDNVQGSIPAVVLQHRLVGFPGQRAIMVMTAQMPAPVIDPDS